MAAPKRELVMPISGHASELRTRAVRAAVATFAASAVGWFITPALIDNAATGIPRLISASPAETLTTYLTTAVGAGAALASPITIYQLWAFILPGLVPEEERFFRRYFPWLSLLFLAGVGFVWKWLYPGIMRNLLSAWGEVPAAITVGSLMSFYIALHLAFGLLFDLPVLMMFLVHSGLVRLKDLLKARKLMYLASFIVAAIVTPPDAASQLLVAVPILVLVEVGILMARLVWRPRRQARLAGGGQGSKE